MNVNHRCPKCGMYKKSHPTTGEYCLHCGWVKCLHTPGPWIVTRDPGSEIGARILEPVVKEQFYFEDVNPDDPDAPFMEALFELHNANNDRLIEAVPELYTLYLEVKEIMKIDNDYYNFIPALVKAKLGRALDKIEHHTQLRRLDRNVKSFMKGE